MLDAPSPALPDPVLPVAQTGGTGGEVPGWLTLLLAAACGLIVTNVYLSQPLIGEISASIGLAPGAGGLIPMMTQLGYGAGLLLIVPLGDLVENRRLVLAGLGATIVALMGVAGSAHAPMFLLCALLVGVGAVAVQVLVPYAAHLAPAATRGRVVGNVMSGLMLGIMLARPVSSLIAGALSWHAVFAVSAAVMAGLWVVLRLALPVRRPAAGLRYGALLRSMAGLARHTPVLQRRAAYHACLFAAFSLFWTAVPMVLAERFHLSQNGIALFALAGVAGAVAAPVAGRAADRGWSRAGTGLAMAAVAAGLALSFALGAPGPWGLGLLVVAAVVLDFGVTANMVLGQRAIYALGNEVRSRLNGLYMATFFLGGAAGSALGGWAYAHGGWPLAAGAGLVLPAVAFGMFLRERRG